MVVFSRGVLITAGDSRDAVASSLTSTSVVM
jgi:hypothetical protein